MAHVPQSGVSVALKFDKYPNGLGEGANFNAHLAALEMGTLIADAKTLSEGGVLHVFNDHYPLMQSERAYFVHAHLLEIQKRYAKVQLALIPRPLV